MRFCVVPDAVDGESYFVSGGAGGQRVPPEAPIVVLLVNQFRPAPLVEHVDMVVAHQPLRHAVAFDQIHVRPQAFGDVEPQQEFVKFLFRPQVEFDPLGQTLVGIAHPLVEGGTAFTVRFAVDEILRLARHRIRTDPEHRHCRQVHFPASFAANQTFHRVGQKASRPMSSTLAGIQGVDNFQA